MTAIRPVLSRSRRAALGIRRKDDEPYATHLPVLMALARLTPIRSVLELGSGPFSTGMFLDRAAFPHLEHLTSFEDDPSWENAVAVVSDDPRLDFKLVDAVRTAVPEDLNSYDLIFIDDSRTVAERSVTLAAVAKGRPAGIVAMHDFEQRGYRGVSRRLGLPRQFVFRTFTPQVGILGSTDRISRASLKRAASVLEEGRKRGIPVTDRRGWVQQLDRL